MAETDAAWQQAREAAVRYRTRFEGFALERLQNLVETRHATYDDQRHAWVISAEATPNGQPVEVRDVDWHAAEAARQRAATPPERRPLAWARAAGPRVTVGLDDGLSLVLQVPAEATRLTISDGDDRKAAIDEARQIRSQIQARHHTERTSAAAARAADRDAH